LINAAKPTDDLSSYDAGLLEGAYDWVDRIVVNASFPLGQTGGGLRSGWRVWQGGEQTLSDAGMKAIAGDFARRLKAWGQKGGIPLIECHGEKDKQREYVLLREQMTQTFELLGLAA
jgi:hypothetical protein